MMKRSIFAAAVVMISIPAFAQEEPEVGCDNAQTQTDMNICSHLAWQKADKELNAIYPKVRSQLKSDDTMLSPGEVKAADKLLEAQRSWITYRDAHCEGVSFEARGGSMQALLHSSCLEELTLIRTKQLKELIPEH